MAKIITILTKRQHQRYFKFIKRRLAKHVISKAICRYYAARRKRQISKEFLSVGKLTHRYSEFLNKTHQTFKRIFEKNRPIYNKKVEKIQSKQFYAGVGRLSRPKPMVELYWLRKLQEQKVRMQKRWSEVQTRLDCYRRVRRFYVRRPCQVIAKSLLDIDQSQLAVCVEFGPVTKDEHYRQVKVEADEIAKRVIICERIIEHFSGSTDLETAWKATNEYFDCNGLEYSNYYFFLL